MRALGVAGCLAVALVGDLRADPVGTCIELHCYCNGLGEPDTVAPCSASCFDVCGTSGARKIRPARLDRAFLGLVAAQPGWDATYDTGTSSRSTSQLGLEAEAVFGAEQLGLAAMLGVARDTGTSPDPTTPVSPDWRFDLALGLASSPFALLHRRTFEIRFDLGAYLVNVNRLCGARCESDTFGEPGEATSGFGYRLRAGFDLYFGDTRARGVAIDLLYQRSQIGDFADPTEPTSVELVSPLWMLRISWVTRRL